VGERNVGERKLGVCLAPLRSRTKQVATSEYAAPSRALRSHALAQKFADSRRAEARTLTLKD
jgi:hypothetical protein